MKTLGRILIIMLALTIVMGTIYVAVNATTSDATAQNPGLDRGDRPEFPGGDREQGERSEGGWSGLRLIFGAVKDTAIIALIVTLIVLPKGWLQRRKRQPQINSA